jgi:hypothetical protein
VIYQTKCVYHITRRLRKTQKQVKCSIQYSHRVQAQLLERSVDFKGWWNAAHGTLLHAEILFPLEIHPAITTAVPLRSQQTVQNINFITAHSRSPAATHTQLTGNDDLFSPTPSISLLSSSRNNTLADRSQPLFSQKKRLVEKQKQCVELIMNAVTDNGRKQQVTRL